MTEPHGGGVITPRLGSLFTGAAVLDLAVETVLGTQTAWMCAARSWGECSMTEQTTETPPAPDVSEGRRLLTEATEGPWWREYGDVTVARPDPRDAAERVDEPRDARVVRRADHWHMRDPQAIADATLIVWFRNNAAALLDAAEAVQRVESLVESWPEHGADSVRFSVYNSAVKNCKDAVRRALEVPGE